ncbi:hypothetical protein ACFPMF_14575 [Larkinella bovis]|uniref:Uncharacterized protein n=1 Tax=Larkinella bovis TaxID=683041 RepID=A0ABW0IAL8_9BACT
MPDPNGSLKGIGIPDEPGICGLKKTNEWLNSAPAPRPRPDRSFPG